MGVLGGDDDDATLRMCCCVVEGLAWWYSLGYDWVQWGFGFGLTACLVVCSAVLWLFAQCVIGEAAPVAPTDCQVSGWNQSAVCVCDDVGCFRNDTRSVVVFPANGGAECPSLEMTVPCGEMCRCVR